MIQRIIIVLFTMLSVALSADGATKRFTLVIDPGHGGKDPGAIGSFLKEKNVALNVAKSFGRYVEQNCPDVKVIYTRKTDVFVTLEGRANIANRNKADLFISIHCNSLPGRKIARGMETYTLGMHRASDNLEVAKRENEAILYEKDYRQRYAGFDPRSSESYIMFELMQDKNMEQSVEMAKLVQQKTCASAGRQNKGVKQAGFLVLRETSMPSCLVELGFITTPDEERALNSASTVDAYGRGLYQAFVAYRQKVSPKGTVPYKAEPKAEIEVPRIVPQSDEKKTAEKKVAEKKPVAEKTVVEKPVEEKPVEEKTVAERPAEEKPAESMPVGLMQTPAKAPADTVVAEAAPTAQYVAPTFKLQILASKTKLKPGAPEFKKQTGVDSYEEGGMIKYTVGSSTNYSEIYQLRKSLLADFPQAFIIAFRGTTKMDVNEAIREYKANRNKK